MADPVTETAVDPAELAVLRNSYSVLTKLNGDPETRKLLEKGLKKHFPNVVTEEETADALVKPQLEAFKAEVLTPLQEELKALREERAAAQTAATAENLEAAFAKMKKDRGFTDEGIEQVKKLMLDNSIADPHAAAARFAELHPAPKQDVANFSPPAWNLDQNATDFDVKGLFENEDLWADNMAVKTLNEIRVGQAA